MASISKDPGGKRRILFVDPLDKRRRHAVRLGKVSQRIAETVKLKIESLVVAKASGHSVDPETARWVASLSDEFADRLSKVGLIEPRKQREVHALASFLDSSSLRGVM